MQIHDARQQMLKLRKQIFDTVKLLKARVITAPISGTVIAPDRVPEPQRDEINRTKLSRWYGTPLDPENAGCFVDAGMEILKIAPSDKLHAVLYIDQGDRVDLTDGMEIELKLDHLPDISYVAPVTVVSRLGEKVAPEALTTKYGGPLATRPDDKGQETLTSTAYRATVEMHFVHEESKDDAALIQRGMRGNARILVDNRTIFQWAKLYFYETFRFRL